MPLDHDESFPSVADSWIQTFTGKRYHFFDIKPEDIEPRDIAHALSMICRYNGHITKFYSVAEHCYIMARYAIEVGYGIEVAASALLHDAAEAYLGDVTTPLKRHLGHEYAEAELKANHAISKRFGIDLSENRPTYRDVKELDRRILRNEVDALCLDKPDWMPKDLIELPKSMVVIEAWEPGLAEYNYMKLMEDLFESTETRTTRPKRGLVKINAW